MLSYYLIMCLQTSNLQWHALSGLYLDRMYCTHALREVSGICRCERYIIVLEQRGDE